MHRYRGRPLKRTAKQPEPVYDRTDQYRVPRKIAERQWSSPV